MQRSPPLEGRLPGLGRNTATFPLRMNSWSWRAGEVWLVFVNDKRQPPQPLRLRAGFAIPAPARAVRLPSSSTRTSSTIAVPCRPAARPEDAPLGIASSSRPDRAQTVWDTVAGIG